MSGCPAQGELVEIEIDRIATQYREATKLIGYMRAVLGQAEEAARAICAIPLAFDLDTATGDQLTLIGKRLGWPRCHCVRLTPRMFGFLCNDPETDAHIGGFCDDDPALTWIDCASVSEGQICIADDATYRAYLKARRYQVLGLYDLSSLEAAARHVWGPSAFLAASGGGEVVIAAGRDLTDTETDQLQLFARVMPIAPGVRLFVHLGADPLFGFGTGWGEFCDGSVLLCPIDPLDPTYAPPATIDPGLVFSDPANSQYIPVIRG